MTSSLKFVQSTSYLRFQSNVLPTATLAIQLIASFNWMFDSFKKLKEQSFYMFFVSTRFLPLCAIINSQIPKELKLQLNYFCSIKNWIYDDTHRVEQRLEMKYNTKCQQFQPTFFLSTNTPGDPAT